MFFHLQPTRLTLRLYENEGGYERKEPFIGTAQIDLRSTGEAYIHAMRNDKRMDRQTLRRIIGELVEVYHVKRIEWEHNGKDQRFDTKPADL